MFLFVLCIVTKEGWHLRINEYYMSFTIKNHVAFFRFCTSPTPSLFGLPCFGVSVDFGLCNVFKCGDISRGKILHFKFRLQHL